MDDSPRTRVEPRHLRHLLRMLRQGDRPAVAVYESIGDGYPLAVEAGWLNLGLWEGGGDEQEAPEAVRRLVASLAEPLPRGGVLLDVANGLGVQDRLIAEIARPSRLVAVNITEAQLLAGRSHLGEAGAHPVVADAVRLPIREASADGVISVEAAFHFSSRSRFFGEVRRVLRSGGVLSMSDVTAEGRPRSVEEWLAGLTLLRFWGLRRETLADWRTVAAQAEEAGLVEVTVEPVGERVLDPVLDLVGGRLERDRALPPAVRAAGRLLLRQWRLLRDRRLMEYVLLTARAP